jgi:hypothetical protein
MQLVSKETFSADSSVVPPRPLKIWALAPEVLNLGAKRYLQQSHSRLKREWEQSIARRRIHAVHNDPINEPNPQQSDTTFTFFDITLFLFHPFHVIIVLKPSPSYRQWKESTLGIGTNNTASLNGYTVLETHSRMRGAW